MRLRRLEPVLRAALGGPCALPRSSRLLVAVSGGADSTALLVALASIAHEFGLTLHAAHLHHGLRGADADRDLAHVRALCRRLGVPLAAARCDAAAAMRRRGLSGEDGLRRLRRAWLMRAAADAGAVAIATAHTADDQLETVLMRLARGTGIAGLGGMRPRHGRWLKPLLAAPRRDVEADLTAAGVTWCEDATNRDLRIARNRIRHEVVPALAAAIAPAADAVRARAGLARRAAEGAADARDAARLLARLGGRALRGAGAAATPSTGVSLEVRALGRHSTPVRRAALRLLWRRAAPGAPALTRRHLDALAGLLRSPRAASRVELPGGWQARAARGRIVIERRAAADRSMGAVGRNADAKPGARASDARLRHPNGGGSRTRTVATRRPGTLVP